MLSGHLKKQVSAESERRVFWGINYVKLDQSCKREIAVSNALFGLRFMG